MNPQDMFIHLDFSLGGFKNIYKTKEEAIRSYSTYRYWLEAGASHGLRLRHIHEPESTFPVTDYAVGTGTSFDGIHSIHLKLDLLCLRTL
jgi:hypothetical protein